MSTTNHVFTATVCDANLGPGPHCFPETITDGGEPIATFTTFTNPASTSLGTTNAVNLTPMSANPNTGQVFTVTVCNAIAGPGAECFVQTINNLDEPTGTLFVTTRAFSGSQGPVQPRPTANPFDPVTSGGSLSKATQAPASSLSPGASRTTVSLPVYTGLAVAAYAPNSRLIAGMAVGATWLAIMVGSGALFVV